MICLKTTKRVICIVIENILLLTKPDEEESISEIVNNYMRGYNIDIFLEGFYFF